MFVHRAALLAGCSPWILIFLFLFVSSAQAAETRLYSIGALPFGYDKERVRTLADVNNNGTNDLLVSTERFSNVSSFNLLDGGNGQILWQIQGTQSGNRDGRALAVLGDITGDGISDFISGASGHHVTAQMNDYTGRVQVRNGANGSVIYTFFGQLAHENFGYSVAALGDVDADGRPDAIACAPGRPEAVTPPVASYCKVYTFGT